MSRRDKKLWDEVCKNAAEQKEREEWLHEYYSKHPVARWLSGWSENWRNRTSMTVAVVLALWLHPQSFWMVFNNWSGGGGRSWYFFPTFVCVISIAIPAFAGFIVYAAFRYAFLNESA